MAEPAIRVLVADDHPVVREGLQMLLGPNAAVTAVWMAETAEQAVHSAVVHDPDVVLLDLSIPEMGGLEATRRIVRDAPRSRVLILTTHDEDANIRAAIEAGASGYLLKTSGLGEIASTVTAVHRGQLVFGGGVAGSTARMLSAALGPSRAFPDLTTREFEMLQLLATGMTNEDIARRLALSGKTVANTLSRVFLKLGVARRVEAALLARAAGLGAPHHSS